MIPKEKIDQFISQFTPAEYRQLCRHRGFVYLISKDLLHAAMFAEEILNRIVRYQSDDVAVADKPKNRKKCSSKSSRLKVDSLLKNRGKF